MKIKKTSHRPLRFIFVDSGTARGTLHLREGRVCIHVASAVCQVRRDPGWTTAQFRSLRLTGFGLFRVTTKMGQPSPVFIFSPTSRRGQKPRAVLDRCHGTGLAHRQNLWSSDFRVPTHNPSVSCCKGVDRYGDFDGHCKGSMGAPEAFRHKVRSIFQGFSAREIPASCRKLSFKTQVLLHDELGAFSGEYLTHRLQLDVNSQLSRSWWLSQGRQDHLFDFQRRSSHRRPMIEHGRDSRCISRVQVLISDIHSPAWALHVPYNTPCFGNRRSYPCSNFPVIFTATENPPRKSNNHTSWVEIIHPTYRLPLQVFSHRPSYGGPSGPSLHPPALPPVPQLRAGRFPPQRRRPLQRRRIKERSGRSRSLTEHRLETHRCRRRRFHSALVPACVRLDLGDRAGLGTQVAQVAECFKEVTLALLAEDPPQTCLGG